VLLLHGIAGAAADWGGIPKRLAEKRSVVSFDQRGIGASDAPTDLSQYSIKTLAEDAHAVMVAAWGEAGHGADEDLKYDVVGLSLGGIVAQELALAAPSHVASITLASTSVGGREAVHHISADFMEIVDGWLDDDGTTEAEAARRRVAAAFIVNGLPTPWVTQNVDFLKLAVDRFISADKSALRPRAGVLGQRAAFLNYEASAARLHDVQCRALILHGDADAVVDAHAASALAASLPRASLLYLAGVGHHAWIQEPVEWADCVLRFLDEASVYDDDE